MSPKAPSEVGKKVLVFFFSQHRWRPPGTPAARALRRRILAGDGAPCIRREALRLPSGPGSPRQLCPRLSQGALSVRAGRPAAAAPLASPSCSLSLLLPPAGPPALRLQLSGLPRRRRVRLLLSSEDCTHLQRPRLLARRTPAPAGCGEQRRERTGPSSFCSEPRGWGEGKPASSGSGSRSEPRSLGCSLAGLGPEDQQIQLAQGTLGDGEPCTLRGARGLQRRRAGVSRARGPGRLAGLPPGAAASRCPMPSPRLGPGSPPGLARARSLFAELPARQGCPLLRSGTTDRRGRPLPPLRLAPGPPPASQPNQLQPRGGYHGDAAPRPPPGGAGGRHARFSRQNSKAGRAALQPLYPSWDEAGPAPGGLQLPACCAAKMGEGVPTGSSRHAGSCSPSDEDLGLNSSIIY